MPELQTRTVRVGEDGLCIGSGHPIVVQTMCNTHTSDVEATVAQCRRLAAAGSQLIRITVPSLSDVPHIAEIRRQLRLNRAREFYRQVNVGSFFVIASCSRTEYFYLRQSVCAGE